MEANTCLNCGTPIPLWCAKRPNERQKYCSHKCGAAYRNKQAPKVTHHTCRMCGTVFPIRPDQGQKWLCSDACRRASNAKSVREFHKRRPQMEAIYRARTRAKLPPDSQNRRFYALNPDAPRACQSCGEARVTEIAHKPGHERLGQRRSRENLVWPEKVWVLCPTCHRLIDRMNYPLDELGLS